MSFNQCVVIFMFVFLVGNVVAAYNITVKAMEDPPKTYIVNVDSDVNTHSYNCTITAYSNEVSQTDSTPNQTAILEKPKAGWTCAVSHDLKQYLGNKIYVYGYGVFKVNDLMNKRYTKRIDLFMGKSQAIEFGRKDNVTVVFI